MATAPSKAQEYVQRSNRINEKLAKHNAQKEQLSKHLVEAGDEAVDALKQLLEDQAFWDYLKTKRPEEDKSADPYSPAATKYHVAVLTALGYKPPPPAQELVDEVSKAILAERGKQPLEFEQVRQRIVALKDSAFKLTEQARKQVAEKPAASKSRFVLSERLKGVLKATSTIITTAAAAVSIFFGPLFPPKPPPPSPPVVIVIPSDQLPPELRQPPPGAEQRGPIYFYKGLPPPDEPPPGPPRQPRST